MILPNNLRKVVEGLDEAGAGDAGVVAGEDVDAVVRDRVDRVEGFPGFGGIVDGFHVWREFDDDVGVEPHHRLAGEDGEGELAFDHVLASSQFQQFVVDAGRTNGLDGFRSATAKGDEYARAVGA